MTPTFLIGLFGSLILVTGSALPDKPTKHPYQSVKNWCFGLGAVVMATYSTLNYLAGGPVFFIFLQALVILASVFMMLDVDDRIDTPIIIAAAAGLVGWSFYLSQGWETLIFILGLVGIALGYELKGGTLKRELALIAGSILIAAFSYLSATWIFFWLNVFFALFSGWQAFTLLPKRRK